MSLTESARLDPDHVNSGCWDCLATSIAGAAVIVYSTVELAKWALNHLKEFFVHFFTNLYSYLCHGWHETVKVVVALAEGVALVAKGLYAVVTPLFIYLGGALYSGMREVGKILKKCLQLSVKSHLLLGVRHGIGRKSLLPL